MMLRSGMTAPILRAAQRAARGEVSQDSRRAQVPTNKAGLPQNQAGLVDAGIRYWVIGFDGLSDTDTWTLG